MRAILLPLMAIFLAGCEEIDLGSIGGVGPLPRGFSFSFPLSSGGSLRIENFNGSVEISGWDKNTVEIDGHEICQHRIPAEGNEDRHHAVGEFD